VAAPLNTRVSFGRTINIQSGTMGTATRGVRVKRVYEKPSRTDGVRVLVDRLWPRGLTKQAAALDAWLKDLAPSDELRQWYHAYPQAWSIFRRRYLKELTTPEASAQLQDLYHMAAERKPLTLLYASKNEEQNNAIVLRDLLNGMKKPPTGTGPTAAFAGRLRKAARRPA
jgi:uncharacterized protein YeaO (DUF488 family)